MAAPATHLVARVGLGLCLLAGASGTASASALKLRNAQVQPLAFAELTGWRDDDHAAAYATFQKSCGAIKHGTKKMRAARPVYGALFNVCARSLALGDLGRDDARLFF